VYKTYSFENVMLCLMDSFFSVNLIMLKIIVFASDCSSALKSNTSVTEVFLD